MIRVKALVSPKCKPAIAATRSNRASATRPQFRAPITAKARAATSSFFISLPPLLLTRVESLSKVTIVPKTRACQICVEIRVEMLYGSARGGRGRVPADRRAGPADGHLAGAPPSVGAALRAAAAV